MILDHHGNPIQAAPERQWRKEFLGCFVGPSEKAPKIDFKAGVPDCLSFPVGGPSTALRRVRKAPQTLFLSVGLTGSDISKGGAR
jgi:hypothetical protein